MTNLSGANLNNGTAVGPQGEGRESPSRFPKYPAYKDSGVDWLGEVPLGWRVGNLKHALVELVSGGTPESNNSAYWSDGDGIPWVAISDMTRGSIVDSTAKSLTEAGLKSKGLRVIPAGGLLYSIYASIGRVAVLGLNAATNQAILGLMLDSQVAEQSFIKWWLVSLEGWVKTMASSNTQDNLNAEKVRNLPLVFPSLLEQAQVTRFLDHETARIDALIEEQQRLIELLKEKRQAVISHAVTKGLDPTEPMKDSGVEWLGEVPAHWKVSKLGHYAQILTGFPFPSASFSHDESDVRLLRGANIGVGSLKWIDTVYWELNEGDELSSYLMTEGQIVLGMDRPWISEGMRIARVTQDDMPCLLLQRVAAITPNAGINDEYLYCLLASELFKAYVEPDLTGVSVPHISPEQILSFQIPVPHIDEQRKISRFIKDQLDQMSALFQQASESVELLQERRAALISAAVTGKIDVRGWQPPASTQAPELEKEAV